MNVQFRPKRFIKPIINIAPLIDVLFLLLIFFMVTSTFIEQPNIKLELPSTKHTETSRTEKTVLMLSRDGKVYLKEKLIDKEDLEKVLRRILLDTGEDVLVLKADKFVPYGDVVDIMDFARGAGFKKVIAPTITEGEMKQ
ncbi:MAG: biopolymer transporter ExbD [Candidatus Scalindua sp. AMX11]|nr:MAG: biopolymer transporter ExbD [Candidatus Scalindua sp.]RZV76748.1 MAG: biopolymer transporter ExbD [Candidatus Scalindua sp. SCAELEC01]TDE63932.1 MAG: biopolymer transporter ExbD [Candidatus Scalindua sp. AMX11]